MILSILIPVFNEEASVSEILKKVRRSKLPGKIGKEIIVVDDASKDLSLLKLKKEKGIKLLVHTKNKGKGAAIRTGLKEVKGDIILIQDADLEYDPGDYERLLAPIIENKSKVVYGSRLKKMPLKMFGPRHTPFVAHYFGNKFLTFVTNLLYGDSITDMETCYKVMRREVVNSFKLYSNRFEFEPEITAKILKKGYKIYEVPIKVKPRGYKEGKKITWKDGFLAVWTLLKYRFVD